MSTPKVSIIKDFVIKYSIYSIPNGAVISGANSFTSVTVTVTVTVAEYSVPSESAVSSASTFNNTRDNNNNKLKMTILTIAISSF